MVLKPCRLDIYRNFRLYWTQELRKHFEKINTITFLITIRSQLYGCRMKFVELSLHRTRGRRREEEEQHNNNKKKYGDHNKRNSNVDNNIKQQKTKVGFATTALAVTTKTTKNYWRRRGAKKELGE